MNARSFDSACGLVQDDSDFLVAAQIKVGRKADPGMIPVVSGVPTGLLFVDLFITPPTPLSPALSLRK
jgi:hypothetical protein